MNPSHKPVVFLAEPPRSPPIGQGARIEIGYLIRRLQRGESLALPASRPMPSIGRGVAELRVTDGGNVEWRVIYRIDDDAVIVVAVFKKKTQATPTQWIETSQARLRRYDARAEEE